ncbi:MAG: alpha/beta hydrolase [Patescibacteria group bacterium]|jgi:hypothetical protein
MDFGKQAIIIRGNGNAKPSSHWFPYVERELTKLGLEVVNVEFPDPVMAHEREWLPFLDELGADENTILIGHSSGAVAAMRYAEKNEILGSVLVGACYTDLGDAGERESGYYDRPWDWEAIKKNQRWIVQFASTDDPLIPIAEARHIHEVLGTEYTEFTDRQHFGYPKEQKEFPELVASVREKLKR